MRDFKIAEEKIIERGHIPINPTTLHDGIDKTWGEFLGVDLMALIRCEAIYLLDTWIDSRGAKLEYLVASYLGLDVLNEKNFTKIQKDWYKTK
jgi:hypothetical protein